MICASHKFPAIVRRYGAFRRAMEEAHLPVPEEYMTVSVLIFYAIFQRKIIAGITAAGMASR